MEDDTVRPPLSDGMRNRVAGLKLKAKLSDMENELANCIAEIHSLKKQLSGLKEERLVADFDIIL